MTKPFVIAIHGMGSHDKLSFTEDIIKSLDKGTEHFSGLKKFGESVNLRVIEYNTICEKVRKMIENSSSNLPSLIGELPGFNDFLARITQLQSTVKSDDAFWKTHWLDVLTYHSLYQVAIQLHVAEQFLGYLSEANDAGQDVHIVAHSLGTAVIHDTLHKLYKKDFTQEQLERIKYFPLNPAQFPIKSITMIANISKLDLTGINPYKSIVRLLPKGITFNFIDVRHSLDPIPLLRPFSPPADWDDSISSTFQLIRLQKVERVNVHDVEHYLADPKLYLPFFQKIFFFDYTEAEHQAAIKAHNITTAQGKFDQVVAAAKAINVDIEFDQDERKLIYTGKDSIQTFELALNQIIDFLKTIEVQFN